MRNICKDCRLDAICKYQEEAKCTCSKVDEIAPQTVIFSPISIKVECSSFERKTQKQDGIYFRK